MIILKSLFILVLSIFNVNGYKTYCNIPKECQVIEITKRQLPTNQKQLICLLNEGSQLRFNKSLIDNVKSQNCQQLNKNETNQIIIRPYKERSLKLKREIIDLANLIEFTRSFHNINLTFELFNGFEINLFDKVSFTKSNDVEINCIYCTFDFYLGDKLLKTCQDFIEATNSTNPRSIFQLFMFTTIYKKLINLYLTETNVKICPLVFKDVQIYRIRIFGENSFLSKRLLTFSPEKYENLSATIENIDIIFDNVDLDFNFLHPSVFKNLKKIVILNKVNRIHPELFHVLNNVSFIFLTLEFMRNLMHNNGIEWIKNINKNIYCDLNNRSEIIEYARSRKVKFIYHDPENRPLSPMIRDVFPDQDFCLYKDFPINQLVVLHKTHQTLMELNQPRRDMGCVYLWITRSYKSFLGIYNNETNIMFKSVLESDEYKSISKCSFDEKVKLCNRSTFEKAKISTLFETAEAMYIIEIVLNISSLTLSILGLISNILIIITISSKMNETDFKEFKQYDYLRLNSICNCLILVIYMTTWLNQCIYPFQVFCPIIRKTIFMQYFKIIVQDVLLTALRFMNSFTYIGFAFNRISLIGKDHNKLVKFMCKISIKKFIGVSLFISIGFSLIKFFEYDINYGSAISTYPISYEYSISNTYAKNPKIAFFILNFISDMLNHFVLLLLNLAIDIGMIIKLRQTLNERYENFKAFSSTAQQEKKKTDNENVLDNAISMVILNTSLNLLLKLPASLYSFIYLCYSIYVHYNVPFVWENLNFERFFKLFCINANFCDMLQKLSDFLYLLSISLQFFFYKHYDKKLNSAIKKKFGSKKDIQTGLYSLFNLVNMVTSPDNAEENLETKIKSKTSNS